MESPPLFLSALDLRHQVRKSNQEVGGGSRGDFESKENADKDSLKNANKKR